MELAKLLPDQWRLLLHDALNTESFKQLELFLDQEYREQEIFPPLENLFHAFRLTPPDQVKAVILGQDPYHDNGQAHGLAFSVRPGVRHPPSLRNIFKELNTDIGVPIPESGSLESWAKQGVLLLNTVLTVRAHAANSHRKHGWETFTDSVIRTVNGFDRPVVFVLWGDPAQKKTALIDQARHKIIASAHPSPLSAYRGFFGSRPFPQSMRACGNRAQRKSAGIRNAGRRNTGKSRYSELTLRPSALPAAAFPPNQRIFSRNSCSVATPPTPRKVIVKLTDSPGLTESGLFASGSLNTFP